MSQLTRLTLSHNKLTSVPPSIADLINLQVEAETNKITKNILDPYSLEQSNRGVAVQYQ